MCFFQIDSCRLVQSLTSWNVSVFYGRFRFYRGEEVIVYSHLRRPSSVICYQLCIQRVCLSTQVGDMLVQRLAPPICYLCMSFRWFMPRFPPQNRLVLRVLNPRQKHTIKSRSCSLFLSVEKWSAVSCFRLDWSSVENEIIRRLNDAFEMIDVSADLLKQRAAAAVADREGLFLAKGDFFFPLCLYLFILF